MTPVSIWKNGASVTALVRYHNRPAHKVLILGGEHGAQVGYVMKKTCPHCLRGVQHWYCCRRGGALILCESPTDLIDRHDVVPVAPEKYCHLQMIPNNKGCFCTHDRMATPRDRLLYTGEILRRGDTFRR